MRSKRDQLVLGSVEIHTGVRESPAQLSDLANADKLVAYLSGWADKLARDVDGRACGRDDAAGLEGQ